MQDALIRHYGYDAEKHTVVTDDDYVLTVFRCNAKKFANKKRKPVIIQHGLLISSDDFCINIPEQSLGIEFGFLKELERLQLVNSF